MTDTAELFPAAPSVAELARRRALEFAITEHVLGWRWYELTDRQYRQIAADPKRAAAAAPEAGTRFLADPVYGEGCVIRGTFSHARAGVPISRGAVDHAGNVTRNPLIAFGALHAAMNEWRLEADGQGFACRATRGLGFGDGRADGPDLPIVICESLAQALRLHVDG